MSSCSDASDSEFLPDIDDLRAWSRKKLVVALQKRQKKYSGRKEQLANRLFKVLNSEDSDSTDDEAIDDVSITIPMSADPGWHRLDVLQIPPIDQDDRQLFCV